MGGKGGLHLENFEIEFRLRLAAHKILFYTEAYTNGEQLKSPGPWQDDLTPAYMLILPKAC